MILLEEKEERSHLDYRITYWVQDNLLRWTQDDLILHSGFQFL